METLSCRGLKGGLYGGDLGLENVPKVCLLEDATEKTQHVIEIAKCCVTGVGAIKAKQAGVPAYQSPIAIWHWYNPLQMKIIYCSPPVKIIYHPHFGLNIYCCGSKLWWIG